MKLALFGCCPDTAALANAALADGRFEVVGICESQASGNESLAQIQADLPRFHDWQRVLVGGDVDAVIVAGRPPRGTVDQTAIDEQLKRLVQEGIPTLVVHPTCEAIVAYELDMIRSDTNCVLLPYFPGIAHPLVDELRGWVDGSRESPIGAVEQIAAERTLAHEPTRPLLDDFVRDMNRIRHILGDVEKVSGLGNVDESQGPLTLSVNLTSRAGKLARWTVGPRRDESMTTFFIGGSSGSANLLVPDSPDAWRLATDADSEPRPVEQDWNGTRATLDRLLSAVAGREARPNWADACSDMEIADSLSVSLRRGRTIQLHHEPHTEEGSFKGIMAVGGCGLLLIGMLVLIVFSVVEGFRMPRGRVAGVEIQGGQGATEREVVPKTSLLLRLWPVYPFAAFVLLQLFRTVFRTNPTGDQPSPAGHEVPDDNSNASQRLPHP